MGGKNRSIKLFFVYTSVIIIQYVNSKISVFGMICDMTLFKIHLKCLKRGIVC